MSGLTSRRKGRRGETTAKRLLRDREYTILADTTAGIATDDLVVKDPEGRVWSVEVKNQKSINPSNFRKQARENAGRNHWMVLAHIDGTSAWLVLRPAARPTVWYEK